MRLILFLVVFATVTLVSAAEPRSYTIAPDESMAKTLKFDKPVKLFAQPLGKMDADLEKAVGKPLAAFAFRDSDATEYSYQILIYPAGAAWGSRRTEFERSLKEGQEKLEKYGSGRFPSIGISEVEGRKVLKFPLGGGAGGESTAILFAHRTEPIEMLVIQDVSYRKPPYPDNKTPDAKPAVDYRDAVSAIESMVTAK